MENSKGIRETISKIANRDFMNCNNVGGYCKLFKDAIKFGLASEKDLLRLQTQ